MKTTGFHELDRLVGGLSSPGSYLLLGAPDAGRTALCLSFAQQGVQAGETVAYVSDRAPETVIEQGRNIGIDLKGAVQSKLLLFFEYPEDIAESVRNLEDHSRVVEEFRSLLGDRHIDRLVVDPLTPLVNLGEAADPARCRSILESFSGLGTCAVFTMDQARSDLLDSVREWVSGVLTAGGGRLELRGFPELRGATRTLSFADRASQAAPEPEPAAAVSQELEPRSASPVIVENGPRVLIIDPDTSRRLLLRAHLKKSLTVIEADRAREGLMLADAGRPAAVIVPVRSAGFNGLSVIQDLRDQGSNAIVVALAEQPRRTDSQLRALSAGADLWFPPPVDGRVVRLTLCNLCQRMGTNLDRPAEDGVTGLAQRRMVAVATFTSDLRVFGGRIAREVMNSRESGFPFVIVTLRVPELTQAVDELAQFVQAHSRGVVYVGLRGVACVIPDTHSPQRFLDRFWTSWQGAMAPIVEELPYRLQDAFVQQARLFVASRLGWRRERSLGGNEAVGSARSLAVLAERASIPARDEDPYASEVYFEQE
jgi:CheY-like chemotaxis protein